MTKPIFKGEGHPNKAYKYNKNKAKPGPYQTRLSPKEEERFHKWAHRFKKKQGITVNKEYDYRGWWRSASINERHKAIHKGGHFTDKYKTPYDTSFSNQSKYSKKNNPDKWRKDKNGNWVLRNTRTKKTVVRESDE